VDNPAITSEELVQKEKVFKK